MDFITENLAFMEFKRKSLLMRLFIVFFTVSITATVIPSGIVISQGLFGEVKCVVVDKSELGKEQHLLQAKHKAKATVQAFNIWLLIIIAILVLSFKIHSEKAPPHQTLVSARVRMDN
ncbi:hypothetical protein R2R35_04775 [Anaerocolumna sp. AGMB13020]|uniref:hypothetical protein n=1 Tax=Anaerocolumna sp. AGMB13020 TaxID=3081750 RepID=UPI002954DE92|nr:hypothetical protein [Anaerocolumna sp. AGMB13020]WOO37817.1 hypothetical protein R2R35_04775 [Anaerocolumna sp. AGMB13020]